MLEIRKSASVRQLLAPRLPRNAMTAAGSRCLPRHVQQLMLPGIPPERGPGPARHLYVTPHPKKYMRMSRMAVHRLDVAQNALYKLKNNFACGMYARISEETVKQPDAAWIAEAEADARLNRSPTGGWSELMADPVCTPYPCNDETHCAEPLTRRQRLSRRSPSAHALKSSHRPPQSTPPAGSCFTAHLWFSDSAVLRGTERQAIASPSQPKSSTEVVLMQMTDARNRKPAKPSSSP